jgi:ribosomal protein L11 methylase PrmA
MHEVKLYEHAPSWSRITEHALYKGDISHGLVLSRAMKLCKEATGVCIWPDIPEEYWQQAVKEMLGDVWQNKKYVITK